MLNTQAQFMSLFSTCFLGALQVALGILKQRLPTVPDHERTCPFQHYCQIRCIALRVCKLRRDFVFSISVNHLSEVGAKGNHNDRTRSPSLARKNKTDNGEGNRDKECNFCRGKEADTVLFSQVTRIRNSRVIFEPN